METNTESKSTLQNASEKNYTVIGKTNNRDNNDFSEEELGLLDFSKNAKMIEARQIEGTPFNEVITDEGNFIALGQSRLTRKLTEKEVSERVWELRRMDWEFVMAVIAVITKQTVALHHLEIMHWENNRQEEELKEK